MTTKTILLIHSEPNLQELIQACLCDLGGWHVLTALSLAEGLKEAIDHTPDAIVLGFPTNDINGLRALKQLRAQLPNQLIPIVLLASSDKWANSQFLELMQQYQVAGVIPHSFDLIMLPVKIANLLGWSQDQ